MLTFQDAIFALQQFWASEGCLIWQPYYQQIGAGTMNPATFLRVLGPEPWRVAHVEPSVRPDDARYGENPNRMGTHYQFQVILKPDPGNPQELYLRSLAALGIDPRKHDIRFVEDNWEQPALAAWGLGWEVWLDGLEITQFTYFQRAGGQALDPVSVELTYGLERILMAVQDVRHFADIQWDDRRTYGDLNLAAEQQQSKYYFEEANVELLREMFDGFEAESKVALAANLVFPAYDYLLKCSHTFNVLDTRGSIGVAERAAYFGRMRKIARKVANAYVQDRKLQAYPWLVEQPEPAAGSIAPEPKNLDKPDTFLLEVGSEELPSADQVVVQDQLQSSIIRLLEAQRLNHGKIRVLGTPRRLIVEVEQLAPSQDSAERTVKGPPWNKAFDESGAPTPAGTGFANSSGVDVKDLVKQELDGGTFAVAEVSEGGRPAWQVLGEALPKVLADLHFDKSMRWNASGVEFSRPIRWLLALHGSEVVPFEYAGLQSGRTTRGLLHPETSAVEIDHPHGYFDSLHGLEIIADPIQRSTVVSEQVSALAKSVSATLAADEQLLLEVTNLVEAPNSLLGDFDEAHLALPKDVLISVMKVHQRYFPVEADGRLLPHFVVVANGVEDPQEIVKKGNEHVVAARFADATYFVKRDLERPLESYVDDLEGLTFQAELGSMLAKTKRLEALSDTLADFAELSNDDKQSILRAARLCKADLATQMVIDMTSLEGAMGRYYALESGEDEAAANAIYEHYLPRSAGDVLPETSAGRILALADRLDSLMGLFSIGAQPTGTRDPFALRRAALGLILILVDWDLRIDLRDALGWAWDGYARKGEPDTLQDCLAFIVRRHQRLLLDRGQPHDVVEAVLAAQGHDPAGATVAVDELATWVNKKDWSQTLQAYSRCVRITRDLEQTYDFDEKRITEGATRTLFDALSAAEQAERKPGSIDDFLTGFTPMIPAIDRFFDDVMVMDEVRSLRENRLGLLQRIVQLASGAADLSKLDGF